mmetsp:Transcript_26161/g.37181  ORF Transcript_26161/g.37181 Transcript_26161/m.37181 type:complete len:155 (+) Transcript_26161:595-1059(+)
MNLIGFNLNVGQRAPGVITNITGKFKGLKRMCRSFSNSLEWKMPMVLQPLKSVESAVKVYPPVAMGYHGAPTATCDFSVNLGNASHYDPGDVGPGVAVWAEKIKGDAKNWFFVLPNVLSSEVIQWQRKEYLRSRKGISIRLSNGVCILWNGKVI